MPNFKLLSDEFIEEYNNILRYNAEILDKEKNPLTMSQLIGIPDEAAQYFESLEPSQIPESGNLREIVVAMLDLNIHPILIVTYLAYGKGGEAVNEMIRGAIAASLLSAIAQRKEEDNDDSKDIAN